MRTHLKFTLATLLMLSSTVTSASVCEYLATYFYSNTGSVDWAEFEIQHTSILPTFGDEKKLKRLFSELERIDKKGVKPQVFEFECEKSLLKYSLRSDPNSTDSAKKDKNLESSGLSPQMAFSVELANVFVGDVRKNEQTKLEAQCKGSPVSECSYAPTGVTLPFDFEALMNFEENNNRIAGKDGYDTVDCSCKEANLRRANKDVESIEAQSVSEKDKLKALVTRASYRKFLDEYTALNEDLQYFGTTDKWFFADRPGETQDQILCVDPSGFKKEVESLCGQNGMLEGSQERMSKALGSMNPKISGMRFEEGMAALSKEIGVLEFSDSAINGGKPVSYKRTDYDNTRLDYSVKTGTVSSANKMLSEIMANPELKKDINKYLDEDKSPLYAILQTLTNQKNSSHLDELLGKLSKSSVAPDAVIFSNLVLLRFSAGMNISFLAKYSNELNGIFENALRANPSFKNMLMDKKLFRATSDAFKYKENKLEGMLGVLEKDKKNLQENFRKRCVQAQKNLATVVCTKPEIILRDASASDVAMLVSREQKFLKDNYPESNPDVLDRAICNLNHNTPDTKSYFSSVLLGNVNPLLRSDYTDRMAYNNQNNSFYKLVKAAETNKEIKKEITAISQSSRYAETAIDKFRGHESRESAKAGLASLNHDASQAKVAIVPDTAAKEASEAPSSPHEVARSVAPTPTFNQSSHTQSFVTPTVASSASAERESQSIVPSESDFKDRLANELSKTAHKGPVKELMSSVSAKDAEEIFRLRDQAMKDSQTISELRLQQERDKTAALKNEYESLKERFEKLEKATPVQETVKGPNISTGGIGSGTLPNAPQFDNTAKIIHPMAEASVLDRGPASTSMGQSAAQLGSASNGASAASGSAQADSPTLAITVTRSLSSDGKVITAEDHNKALISYLSKNEPTIQQLQELKASGLMLTEEDISKDGQKIKVKKLIKFSELSPEAKNLVEKKLAQIKLQEVKRNYSRQALLLELFSASHKKTAPVNF